MSLPADPALRGARIVPRVWIIETTAGVPKLPQSVTVDDAGTPRAVPLWSRFDPCDVGEYPGRAYRHANNPDRLLVLARVAAVSLGARTGALVLAFVPAAGGRNALLERVEASFPELRKVWPAVLADDGVWEVPALDADKTTLGGLAQAAWPADWRRYLSDDVLPGGAPGETATAGVPTGPRIVGAVLA